MGKIVFFVVIGMFLVGCGREDNEVTNKKLNGDWSCTTDVYISRKDNGVLSDFEKIWETTYHKVKFEERNGDLYFLNNSNEWIKQNLIVQNSKTTSIKDNEDSITQTKTSSKLSMDGNDLFKRVVTSEIIDKDSKLIEFINKHETICTRIK